MRTQQQIIDRARELAASPNPGIIAIEMLNCIAEGMDESAGIAKMTMTCGNGGIRIADRIIRKKFDVLMGRTSE